MRHGIIRLEAVRAGATRVLARIHGLASRLLPPVCALCGDRGSDGMDLCGGCRAELPENTASCVRCALPLPAEGLCGQCLQDPPPYVASLAPFHYRPPVDSLITALKFNGRLSLARLLGELMAQRIAERLSLRGEPPPDLIVPVPLHPSRLRERGYNQALELARPIARHLGIPIEYRRCRRVRRTSAQTRLSARERRLNVKGAFRVDGPIAARHVAIVDDVVTTGHTVQELSLALLHAGAERVVVWSCARTSAANR